MKQKFKWAEEYEESFFMAHIRAVAAGEYDSMKTYKKAWLAGFEFAKNEITKHISHLYKDAIKGLGEEEI